MTGIYDHSLARNLPTVRDHIESMNSETLKIVGVGIDGAEKVLVVYHGKQDTFRYTPIDCLIDRLIGAPRRR
jgi:hypothetical protein